jgi:hypothetical protein
MADYQPLITRAVASLQGASTPAMRYAIYERLRKAQLAQLGMRRSQLSEGDVAREKEALEQAIALFEAKFGGAGSARREPFAAATPHAHPEQASLGFSSTDEASTEDSLPLSDLATVARPGKRDERSKAWLWFPLAAVLGAIVVIAGASTALRHIPRQIAESSPSAPQDAAPQRAAGVATQSQSLASLLDRAASESPAGPPMARPAEEAPNANTSAAPGAARAAMLIASDNPQHPVVSLGSALWSIIPPAPGQPATVAVKADADIPDLKIHATMVLRKNTDPSLQATHTIDLKFSFTEGAPIRGIKSVEPKMRNLDSQPSEPLTSATIKVSDAYFLIALVNSAEASDRNAGLMKALSSFDFALLFSDNRVGKLVIQKSLQGEAMLAKAFEAWK